VDRAGKRRVLDFLAPLFPGVGFVVKLFYKIIFAWWLDPWLQGKANRALWDDVQATRPPFGFDASRIPSRVRQTF